MSQTSGTQSRTNLTSVDQTLQQLSTLGPPDLQPVPTLDHQTRASKEKRPVRGESRNHFSTTYNFPLVNLNQDKINIFISKMAVKPKLMDAVISCHSFNDVKQCSSQLSQASSHLRQDQGAQVKTKRMMLPCFPMMPMMKTWWRTKEEEEVSLIDIQPYLLATTGSISCSYVRRLWQPYC